MGIVVGLALGRRTVGVVVVDRPFGFENLDRRFEIEGTLTSQMKNKSRYSL